MPIIDTHAHICDPLFDKDRAEVLKHSAASGVISIVAVSETLSDAKLNLLLAKQHNILKPAAGLYPTLLNFDEAQAMASFIEKECDRLVGIGEVGLDFWTVKGEEEHEIQKEIFGNFIDLSLKLDLPLNVHSRSAGRHALALLSEKGAKKVQLHAFDGKASSALPGVEQGYLFSIPPSITRSKQKQKLVKKLPLSSLMIETDSPVLGPQPEVRNEPSNALIVIDAISQIKDISREEIREMVYENTINLYGEKII